MKNRFLNLEIPEIYFEMEYVEPGLYRKVIKQYDLYLENFTIYFDLEFYHWPENLRKEDSINISNIEVWDDDGQLTVNNDEHETIYKKLAKKIKVLKLVD